MVTQKIKNLFSLFLLLSFYGIYGQQDPQYTQYMYNTLSVNPAYAGSKGALSITGVVRSQWVGMNDAPDTQSLTVQSPIMENMGLGLTVVNDNLGPIHQTIFNIDYSYNIQMDLDSYLAFGLKAGANFFQGDLLSLSTHENENNRENIDNRLLPNVGVGIYYYSGKGYLGLSAPRLLERNLKTEENSLNYEQRHYFLIGGYVFRINESLKFKPSFLLKAVAGAPLSIDLSANFFINDKIGAGVAYRFGDSLSALLQYYFSPQFRIGYAYDYTMTELRHYTSGTHEIMLGYDLFGATRKVRSPRFF